MSGGKKEKRFPWSPGAKAGATRLYRKLPPGPRKLVRGLWMRLYGKPLLSDTEKLLADLNAPASDDPAGRTPVLTAYMYMYWRSRPEIRAIMPLDTPEARLVYVIWFTLFAARDHEIDLRLLPRLTDFALELNQPVTVFPRAGCGRVAIRLMSLIWTARPDLQKQFGPDSGSGWAGFEKWCQEFFRERFGPDNPWSIVKGGCVAGPGGSRPGPGVEEGREIRSPGGGTREEGFSSGPGDRSRRLPGQKPGSLVKGINVIGHARAESGLGEDVRMTVRALTASGVNFSVYNHHQRLLSRQGDASLESHIHGELPHGVNLFHLPLPDIVGAFGGMGPQAFDGRYNIGYCLWELGRCPDIWSYAGEFVDEIWTPTKFVRDSHAEKISKPVLNIPYPVWLDPPESCDRREFGLSQGVYLFLFAFDFLGNIHRKNPLACIRAFKLAFPDKKEPVGLVIKSMNGWPWDREWRRMRREIKDDPRIRVINQTFDRQRILRLIKACDCYLSLHRSEGFGRGLAEAMLMGKPVVATAYSGNVDFLNKDNSFPVDYKIVPVGPGEHPFGQGQVWAEPDAAQAALSLRALADRPREGVEIGKKARADITAKYNPLTVGEYYKDRLHRLGLI